MSLLLIFVELLLITLVCFIKAFVLFMPTVVPTVIISLCFSCIITAMFYFLGGDIAMVCLLLFGIALVYYGWLPLRQKRNLNIQNAKEEYKTYHAKYLEEMERHERTLKMIRNETEKRYRR